MITAGGRTSRGVDFPVCRRPLGCADRAIIPGPRPAALSRGFFMSEERFEERTRWVYDERIFPIWNSSFDKSDRTEMIRDDLWAGRSIAILLATLVAIGLVLSLVTLAYVVAWR
jgi:hypothetical protein